MLALLELLSLYFMARYIYYHIFCGYFGPTVRVRYLVQVEWSGIIKESEAIAHYRLSSDREWIGALRWSLEMAP